MTPGVTALVLLAAFLHASWNAMLRGGRDRFWAASVMGFTGGIAGLVTACFVPLPARASWVCILISAVVHIAYQLLLVRQIPLLDHFELFTFVTFELTGIGCYAELTEGVHD